MSLSSYGRIVYDAATQNKQEKTLGHFKKWAVMPENRYFSFWFSVIYGYIVYFLFFTWTTLITPCFVLFF